MIQNDKVRQFLRELENLNTGWVFSDINENAEEILNAIDKYGPANLKGVILYLEEECMWGISYDGGEQEFRNTWKKVFAEPSSEERLAAMAPELLNALVVLYEDYRDFLASGDAGTFRIEDSAEGALALSVINKAKGVS